MLSKDLAPLPNFTDEANQRTDLEARPISDKVRIRRLRGLKNHVL